MMHAHRTGHYIGHHNGHSWSLGSPTIDSLYSYTHHNDICLNNDAQPLMSDLSPLCQQQWTVIIPSGRWSRIGEFLGVFMYLRQRRKGKYTTTNNNNNNMNIDEDDDDNDDDNNNNNKNENNISNNNNSNDDNDNTNNNNTVQ